MSFGSKSNRTSWSLSSPTQKVPIASGNKAVASYRCPGARHYPPDIVRFSYPKLRSPRHARPIRSENRALLVASIARGRRWLDELIADPAATTESIAGREGCTTRKINMTISLAFLAPDLVKAAIDGQLPHGMGFASRRPVCRVVPPAQDAWPTCAVTFHSPRRVVAPDRTEDGEASQVGGPMRVVHNWIWRRSRCCCGRLTQRLRPAALPLISRERTNKDLPSAP
jgi:hypothetical protein